jgi:hypothetical protein
MGSVDLLLIYKFAKEVEEGEGLDHWQKYLSCFRVLEKKKAFMAMGVDGVSSGA